MAFSLSKVTAAVLTLAVAICLAGCSGGNTGKVEGRVLIDGEPMGGFEVSFISVKDGSGAIGSAAEGGKYELIQGRSNEWIPVGEYKVTVTPTSFVDGIPMPKVKLDKGYTDPRQATLVKTVEPGRNQIDLEVETKK